MKLWKRNKKYKNKSEVPLGVGANLFDVVSLMRRHQEALHDNTIAFSRYKGVFSGKDIVLLAAGPSVNNFKPIENAVYIGMNRSCLYSKVKLDFLFAIDMLGINSFLDEFVQYEGNQCVKFIGNRREGIGRTIPESLFLKLKNAYKYQTDIFMPVSIPIPVSLDVFPLWNSNSVAHQAMQFALFTNPRRIYLVGCDCSGVKNGHFIEGKEDDVMINSFSDEFWKNSTIALINGWKQLKEFASLYYPETEIISVNPVGLKGMFRDVYTSEYLTEHSDIDTSTVEIMK